MRRREIQGAVTQISRGVASWPGVTLHAHRYGGLGIFWQGQELGQLHPCGLLDVSLTAAQRNRLLRAGRFHRHHTFPHSDWVTLPIDGALDVPAAMNALQLAHARISDAAGPGQVIPASASAVTRTLLLA
jgi:Family of unknown function (DUF5519)